MNQPRNLAASVRQRLLNLAQAQKEDFNLVLTRYGIERLLYRLHSSVAGERFILKGAMVLLGIGNTRMKDFYDLWYLSQHFTFEGSLVSQAIAATFDRRRTPIPTNTPLALTSEFADDETKQRQWVAFVRKGKLTGENLVLNQIGLILHDFLMPPTVAIVAGVEFVGGASLQENRVWSSDLGWHSK
jgi:Nucleotidyl transferase AbiEii toxin, Type IV TA system